MPFHQLPTIAPSRFFSTAWHCQPDGSRQTNPHTASPGPVHSFEPIHDPKPTHNIEPIHSLEPTYDHEPTNDPIPIPDPQPSPEPGTHLTHVTDSGAVHMVSITTKSPTERTATATCRVYFSNPQTALLIQRNKLQKGDVLGVARVAGIMAAKQTPALIPLCHPIAITHVAVGLTLGALPTGLGFVDIRATVSCVGKTGVEMEALTASSTAALTIYDMCKAVDKGISITNLRVIEKTGGKSGSWSANVQTE